MRQTLMLLCVACFAFTAQAQFTLVPKIGFEAARTMVNVNENGFSHPDVFQTTPQAGLRLDYKFKKGHGVFAGVSTSSTTIAYSFTNPENSISDYLASRAATTVRLEGGYQFNTKPIFFRNNNSSNKSSQKSSRCGSEEKQVEKSNCSSVKSYSRCGSMKQQQAKQKSKPQLMNIRFMPQVGMAYMPSLKNDFSVEQQAGANKYSYYAGNTGLAVITGIGVELGKGKTRLLQANLQYTKGISNLGNTVLSTEFNSKSVETIFASRTSSWTFNFGIPLSLAKNPAAKQKRKEKAAQERKSNCEQRRIIYRCSKW
jgi:hypothetical protein